MLTNGGFHITNRLQYTNSAVGVKHLMKFKVAFANRIQRTLNVDHVSEILVTCCLL